MRNPVLMREIKTMFRSAKPFFAVTIYVGVMFSIISQMLRLIRFDRFNGFDPSRATSVYIATICFQMALTFFIVPSLAGTSISSEREKQTLDLMLMTRMTSTTIIRGKLMSSILMFCIMLIASMPVYAISFYYSAVSIFNFLIFMVYCLINAISLGSIAVFFSSFFKKSAVSATVSYAFVLGFTIITAIILAILMTIQGLHSSGTTDTVPWVAFVLLLALNPITSFISMIDFQMGSEMCDDIVSSVSTTQHSTVVVWIVNIIICLIVTNVFIKLSASTIDPVLYKKDKKNKPLLQDKAEKGYPVFQKRDNGADGVR